MNQLNYIVVICAVIFLPAALLGVFWWYVMKRGWGSRWLLATSITIFLSAPFIAIWLAAQANSILFFGVGFSIFTGIVFYIYLRTSRMGNVLIGKSLNSQSNEVNLNEEERNSRKTLAKSVALDIFLTGFLQFIPVIIGAAIIFLSKASSVSTISVALFVMGFSDILELILRPKHIARELYLSKRKIIGSISMTAFAWILALYGLFQGWKVP